MNKNPCDECIVKAMCREGCDLLAGYLNKTLRGNYRFSVDGHYRILSDQIREGVLILYDNDTKWGIKLPWIGKNE
jgi:hypothetical protein